MTQNALAASVNSLEDALGRNFRICSERKNLETIRALYPAITDAHLVMDPVELGGDGLPGFNCPACQARVRVFDFLDAGRANSDPRYCHAAFAPAEDLERIKANGQHCNKTIVSNRLASVQTGIPINEAKSPELISFFLAMKNDGLFDRQLVLSQPLPSCPEYQSRGDEGDALNVEQLAGIWIVSGACALLGVLVTWLQPKVEKRSAQRFHPIHYYDQTGQKTNILHRDDGWKQENTIERDGKLIFVGESRWKHVGGKLGSPKGMLRALTRRHILGKTGSDFEKSDNDDLNKSGGVWREDIHQSESKPDVEECSPTTRGLLDSTTGSSTTTFAIDQETDARPSSRKSSSVIRVIPATDQVKEGVEFSGTWAVRSEPSEG